MLIKPKNDTILNIICKGGLNLDDNKDNIKDQKQEDTENPANDVPETESKTSSFEEDKFSTDELENELSRLTTLFKDELEKAEKESKKDGSELDLEHEIKDLEDIKEEIEAKSIPLDMLCTCCGERERNTERGENYQYCEQCREGMRRYPIGLQYLMFAAIVIILAGFSVFSFLSNINIFNQVHRAEVLSSNKKIVSAAAEYNAAATAFDDKGISAKRLELKAISLSYSSIQSFNLIDTMADELDNILTPFEYRLPWNSHYYKMRNELLAISATIQAYSALVSENKDKDVVPYAEIVQKLEELIDTTTEIPALKGGKTITVKYDAAFIKFCQYLTLHQIDNSPDLVSYLEDIKSISPEYLWLYGYELGLMYAQKGDFEKANDIQNKLFKKNNEDRYSYFLEALIYRLQKDYEASEKSIDEGIKTSGKISEFYRLKAINHILKGEYDKSLGIMQNLIEGNIDGETIDSLYIETIFTYGIAADLAKNKSAMDEFDEITEYYGIEYSKRLQSYFKGELSAEQLFTTGTCDVID